MQIRNELSLRPCVHLGTDDRPPSPIRQQQSKRKDSNVIAKSKAGGNSAGFPKRKNIHAKGNLDRQVAGGPNNSVHWSAYDVKFACVQDANPSRNVIQPRTRHDRNPNCPDLKDSSAIGQSIKKIRHVTRRGVETPQRAMQGRKSFRRRAQRKVL